MRVEVTSELREQVFKQCPKAVIHMHSQGQLLLFEEK